MSHAIDSVETEINACLSEILARGGTALQPALLYRW